MRKKDNGYAKRKGISYAILFKKGIESSQFLVYNDYDYTLRTSRVFQ